MIGSFNQSDTFHRALRTATSYQKSGPRDDQRKHPSTGGTDPLNPAVPRTRRRQGRTDADPGGAHATIQPDSPARYGSAAAGSPSAQDMAKAKIRALFSSRHEHPAERHRPPPPMHRRRPVPPRQQGQPQAAADPRAEPNSGQFWATGPSTSASARMSRDSPIPPPDQLQRPPHSHRRTGSRQQRIGRPRRRQQPQYGEDECQRFRHTSIPSARNEWFNRPEKYTYFSRNQEMEAGFKCDI